MSKNYTGYVRVIGLLSGLAFLTAGIIGCQTSSRSHESAWSLGAGGSAVTSSEAPDPGYGPHAYVRKRISDHFKLEAQGTYARHDVDFPNRSQTAFEMDAVYSSLTAQYEFMPSDHSDVRLFVGGGGSYAWFTNEDPENPTVSSANYEDEGGAIGQVGLKVPWGFHITVSRMFGMEPVRTLNGSELDNTDLDLWMFSAGLNIPF